jgi:DNA-3-methyladenine glycosylase
MESWSISSSASDSDRHRVLSRKFYARDTLLVARELLGKVLVTGSGRNLVSGRIVETEAYHGIDPASHSARGETPRSKIMFGEPGVAYVYFIYGVYEMLNFVTEKKGYPGAVLIRALEPLSGEKLMQSRRRGLARSQWTSGPGRLCQALGIRLDHNGASLQGPEIRVVDDGYRAHRILMSPRVGITRAIENEWRFFIEGNPYVSKSPLNARAREALGTA